MMSQVTKNSIYYIHTTHTIIDYIDELSRRHLSGVSIVHLLDESMLADIKRGDTDSAKSKLQHMVEGALHSGAEHIMVTCTSTGGLINALPASYKSHIHRIETAAIQRLENIGLRTSIVYTNPTVWPEFKQILGEANVSEALYVSAHVENAFDKMLAGDKAGHDQLIKDFLERNEQKTGAHLLAQVSICSALERLKPFISDSTIISMAELGIMGLRETKKL
jgi:Asp/Glu/hydantoin racemase